MTKGVRAQFIGAPSIDWPVPMAINGGAPINWTSTVAHPYNTCEILHSVIA